MKSPLSTRLAALIAAAVCTLAPAAAGADPIVPNANFSLGYTGFSGNYAYSPYPGTYSPGLMYPEGFFTVGSNPGSVHDRWLNMGDHTTGDGSMLIVNGNRVASVTVWSATVAVTGNTLYDFSAWAASTYWRSPSSLAFSINGTILETPLALPSERGVWQQFAAPWFSGSTTTAALSLVNLNTEWNGNDFVLDDIALTTRPQVDPRIFEEVEPVPDSGSTLLLLGAGLVGLAGIKIRYRRLR
jgi:hypothetical protein